MPKLWLLLLAVYAASFAAGVPTEDERFKAAIKQAEEAAAATKEPFGDKNLQSASRFLSSKLIDDMHNGDNTKFFDHLDADSDKEITLAEMEVVQAHVAKIATDDNSDNKGGGFYKMMHQLVHDNSPRGVHGELFAHLDKDGDGKITHEEFHTEL